MPTTNAIDTLSSSDAGDTQDVIVEGHYFSGSDLIFTVQSTTLNGQNKVTLTQPLARATRFFNNSGTDFAGTIYCYEDSAITNGVPDDINTIHLQGTGTDNQSFKAATAISFQDYWLITQLYAVVNEKTAGTVDFKFQIAEQNKVFRTRVPGSASSDGPAFAVKLNPVLIVRPNSDFRISAVASAANTSVEAWANGYLAIVKNP